MTALENILKSHSYRSLEQLLALQSTPVVAVIGAGMSASGGVPGWEALRQTLVQEFSDTVSTKPEKERDKLRGKVDYCRSSPDLWRVFSELRHNLKAPLYRSIIRAELSPADTAKVPTEYRRLWNLPIRGIVSLNLDSFAKRSFSLEYPGVDVKTYHGKTAATVPRVIHSKSKFVYQLHGTADDFNSWVFTRSELEDLYATPGYLDLLKTLYSSCSIIFLGVTASDIAIGSPLSKLAEARIDGNEHYWITDKTDSETVQWASAAGVQLLNYPSGEHGLVGDLLGRLVQAVAPEVDAPPVVPQGASPSSELMPLEQLVSLPSNEIRTILNGHAKYLLELADGPAMFEAFAIEYDEAIDRAWYLPVGKRDVEIFGYHLAPEEASGAFGRVYRAVDREGNMRALKLLRRELRDNLELLHSYRRGVEAMRILAEHSLPGMVPYLEASEIPAFVVMEWVEGPNLAEAKEARLLTEWEDVLWVASTLCKIIRSAHMLPERILHRDIRPANIMLENGWQDRLDWNVVVLDFDLATYLGAEDKSILAESSVLGYLAPEQLSSAARASTRSALVDSFGIGMTLYFLAGGAEPRAFMEMDAAYGEEVRQAVSMLPEPKWRSLPRRVGRLIQASTRSEQRMRLDVSQIYFELSRLHEALVNTRDVEDVDLLCEEIASRCDSFRDYEWVNENCANRGRVDGINLSLEALIDVGEIEFRLSWTALGHERYASLRGTGLRVERATSLLRSGKWEIINSAGYGAFSIVARIVCPDTGGLDEIVSLIDRVVDSVASQN